MIDPAEIRRQAEKWWPDVLRAAARGGEYFPKAVRRIGKVKVDERLRDFERIRARQDALIEMSKNRIGYGYTLHWTEGNFRNVGRNRFINAIVFATRADYLAFLRRTAAFERFITDLELIRGQFPALAEWCVNRPKAIEKYHGEWPYLLAVVQYFLRDHLPDRYYIRELPVAVPTKFVETRKKIISDLLEVLLPTERVRPAFHPTRAFEQRYGLRYREPRLRLRLLDAGIAERYFSGVADLGFSLSEFNALRLPLRRVIVLENKTNYDNLMNFLTLPALRGTAGLFGSGFRVGLLQDAAWLREVDLYYWGDIDAHGLRILGQLRSYFPHVRPFLMDRATLNAYPDYHVEAAPDTTAEPTGLTEEERAFFHDLNQRRLRLEQERIPQERVREVMTALLGTSE